MNWTHAMLILTASIATGCDSFGLPESEARQVASSSDPVAGAADRSSGCLVPSTNALDFGIIPQRAVAKQFFELRNMSDREIEIERVVASCDCAQFALKNNRIQAGETVIACALIDLGHTPDFVGKLRIESKGLAKDGKLVFAMALLVEVRESIEFEGIDFETPLISEGAHGTALVPVPMEEPEP